MLLTKVSIKYFLNTMAQLTLSLYILSVKFSLLYENETSSHGPKNCQRICVYDKKNMKLLKETGVNICIYKIKLQNTTKILLRI